MTKEALASPKDAALKLALEALEYWDVHGKLHQPTEEAITAIKAALAQPQQEPKFWYDEEEGLLHEHCGDKPYGCIPLYTTPPQRTLVGLTDEEILAVNMSTVTKLIDEPIVCDTDHNIVQLALAIEAKLKAKNGFPQEEKNT